MNERNYQKELEKTLAELPGGESAPTLLLHSCCAPCSSYVLEYLACFFRITVFYYNPNIDPPSEFSARAKEQERLIREMNENFARAGKTGTDGERSRFPIRLVCAEYRPEDYYEAVKGLENEPEGGKRCTECFRLRLYEAARQAKEDGFDYFTTTLSISPLKDAKRLNLIGEEAGARYGVKYLNSDFKKKNGYQRSIELSREYGLYRQNYCGCVFSRNERASAS